ncbi:MAG: SDR family NAD(P)-dependent oxidoreductase [Treponema sp.]|jgi:NAD(P)-dependent dehydrogenase (short-subunit alcohol dehydrogenase family)|nr:SDR family NAD(P)-dependent oxidoreductase [Treponema sp.]
MEGIFARRRALVIGGTGGIGRAVALGLAAGGADLTIHGGRSAERLESALAEAREKAAAGARIGGFLAPVTAPVSKAAETILAKTAELSGTSAPDILVLAWGPFQRSPLQETSPENWYFLAENNFIFPGILISAVIGDMITRRWGRILLFGGTNTDTIRGFSTTAAYSAAKTALGALAKSAAKSAGTAGVTCNVVCPGLTDTEYTGEKEQTYHREKNPRGKGLSPGDIAAVALRLLESPVVNGAVIPLDGGVVV